MNAPQRIIIPYSPRPLQRAIHDQLHRFNVLVCHRRFGKTVLCINELIKEAIKCKKQDGRYAYVAPFMLQAKDVAWTYLKRYTNPIPGVQYNESELRVDLPNGARIRLYGADNAERLRGLYFDGVVLDEYGQMSPTVWPEIIRPMLADRGGWAIFIGTPMGDNHFREIYDSATSSNPEYLGPEWWAAKFKASDTDVLSPHEIDAMRRSMSEEQYDRELECSFAASVPGAYYAKALQEAEEEGRITIVRHDPLIKVYTCWDLGHDDDTSIWFIQQKGPQVRVIDYYENHGEHMDHYLGVCREKPYIYGPFILPHDSEEHRIAAYRSPAQIVRNLDYKTIVVPRTNNVQHGINLGRALIEAAWFDAETCAQGLKSLRNYQREWDEDRKVFREKPRHDWASHAADAWRTAAEGLPNAPIQKPMDRYSQKPQNLAPASWMSA